MAMTTDFDLDWEVDYNPPHHKHAFVLKAYFGSLAYFLALVHLDTMGSSILKWSFFTHSRISCINVSAMFRLPIALKCWEQSPQLTVWAWSSKVSQVVVFGCKFQEKNLIQRNSFSIHTHLNKVFSGMYKKERNCHILVSTVQHSWNRVF